MQNANDLSADFHVRDQLAVAELEGLAEQGVRSVVNLRPDQEGEGQPESAVLAAEAERLGLAYHHLPVVPGQIRDEHVAEFAAILGEAPTPTVGFCRTGMRASTLWALANPHGLTVDELLQRTRAAGHDLDGIRPRLAERHG